MPPNKEMRDEIGPGRYDYAVREIEKLGYKCTPAENPHEFTFRYKFNVIRVWPYTGWFQGKGVKPQRGIKNLLRQIKQF